MDAVQRVYRDNMMLALVTSGYTPIPCMLYTMMAGASDLPIGPFVAGSFAGRALKYVLIAALAYVFGPAVHRVLRRYGGVAAVVVVLAILAWVLLRRRACGVLRSPTCSASLDGVGRRIGAARLRVAPVPRRLRHGRRRNALV